jgi:hypothetical protein
MKKVAIFTVLLALTTAMGLAFYSHVQQREREAIESVFAARREAYKNSFHFQIVEKKRMQVKDTRELLHHLLEINLNGCPKDFQQAWLEYVQAYRNFAEPSDLARHEQKILQSATKASINTQHEIEGEVKGQVGLKSFIHPEIGGEIAGKSSSSLGASIEKDNLKEAAAELIKSADYRAALERVEKIALVHGVNAFNDESKSGPGEASK